MSTPVPAFTAFRSLVLVACAFAIQPPAAHADPDFDIPSTSGFAIFDYYTGECGDSTACGSLSGGNSSVSFTANFGGGGYSIDDFVAYAGDPISSIPLTMLTMGGSGPCGLCPPTGSGSLTVGTTTYEMSATFFIDVSSGSAVVPSVPATMTFPAIMGGNGFACTSIGAELSPCVAGFEGVIIPYAGVGFGDIAGSMTFTFTPIPMLAVNGELFSAVFTPGTPTPPVPEPSSVALLIIGSAGVAVRRLRKPLTNLET